MIPLETLRRMLRMYLLWYRIEHDRSLASPRSLWSLEIALEPPTHRQELHLQNILAEDDWRGTDGERIFRHPLRTVAAEPHLDELLAFTLDNPGLKGTKLRMQMLVAPEDREFRDEFTRDDSWEWLSSSTRLTELFLAGTLTGEGVEMERLFHSCHQAEMNRDVTEDLPQALEYWNKDAEHARRQAGPPQAEPPEPTGEVSSRKEPLAPSPWPKYRFYCEEMLEARRLTGLCKTVGLDRVREVKSANEAVESRMTPEELTALVCYIRYGAGLNLFLAP